MLRNELQVALNDVEVACQAAADSHETAADVVEDAALAATLRDLAHKRRADAEALAPFLRELGDLPRAPDSDFETLRDLFARVVSAFSERGEPALEQCRQSEMALESAVQTALEQPGLPQPAQVLLRRIQREIAAARAALSKML